MSTPRQRRNEAPENLRLRPNRRFALVAGTAALVFGAAWTAQSGWMVIVAAALIGVLGASVGPPRRGATSVKIERSVPDVAEVGEEIEVVLAAENAGRRTVLLVEVEDRILGSHRAWIPKLAGGERASYRFRTVCTRRGKHASAPVSTRCAAPFGLVQAERARPVAAELTVVPRVVSLGPLAFDGANHLDDRSARPSHRVTAGEPVGVREYVAGDPRRAVHWRLSARTGRLAVREFRDEADSTVALVVAAGPVPGLGTAEDRAFELMISAAASIGVRALAEGRRLRASSSGNASLEDPDRAALLDWMAGIEAGQEPRLIDAARTLLGGGADWAGTIVVLGLDDSHSLEEVAVACDAAHAAGASPVAIIVSAAKSAGSASDRDSNLSQRGRGAARALTSSGAPTYLIDPERPLDQCLANSLRA